MSGENDPESKNHAKLKQKRRQFEQACCEYMEEFGFEWVEEFTLNGA